MLSEAAGGSQGTAALDQVLVFLVDTVHGQCTPLLSWEIEDVSMLAGVFSHKVAQPLTLTTEISRVVTLSQPMSLPLAPSSGNLLPKIKIADPQGPHTRNKHSLNLRPALFQSIAFYLL